MNNAVAREAASISITQGFSPPSGPSSSSAAVQVLKKNMYAALDTDVERAALKKYDAAIVLNKFLGDHAVQGQSDAQVHECGRGKGGGYRDEQIRQVQTNRR